MASYVPYLTRQDYNPLIQDDQLDFQVLDELTKGTSELRFAESWAMGCFRSRLKQAYDLDYEFRPTLPYSFTKSYQAGDRVTIDFQDWVSATAYALNDLVINNGVGYICTTANSDSTFTIANWSKIGNQYDIYYIPLPYPLFKQDLQRAKGAFIDGYYKVADRVFWENATYECLVGTILQDHSSLIQNQNYASIAPPNVFPNDPINGSTYWKFLSNYTVLAGEYPTKLNSVWISGDNRDPMFIKGLLDLTIYMLHSRISPMNIPELRINNKNETFAWLTNIKNGDDTTDIQPLQPSQGDRIRWGSDVKKINGYG